MKYYPPSIRVVALCWWVAVAGGAWAQSNTGVIHGTVTDPSGAAVTKANVILVAPNGQTNTAVTSRRGYYDFRDLPPGRYSVAVTAPGFADLDEHVIDLAAGQTEPLNVALSIAVEKEKVNVNEQPSAAIDTTPPKRGGDHSQRQGSGCVARRSRRIADGSRSPRRAVRRAEWWTDLH